MKKLWQSGIMSVIIGAVFSLMLSFYACNKEDRLQPSSISNAEGIALKQSCNVKCKDASGDVVSSCNCSGDKFASCGCDGGAAHCSCGEINIDIEDGQQYFLEFISVVSEFKSREAAKVATNLRVLKVAFEKKNVEQYKKFIKEFRPDLMKMSDNEKTAVNQFIVKWGINDQL